MERVDGDEELIREVLGIFLEDIPGILEELKRGVKEGLPEVVARAAHALKGASANIAANRLREYAYQLEIKAKSEDLAGASDLYASLETEFNELKTHLAQYLGK